MIYISAGMSKSGSTLTYNLTNFVLDAAGFPYIQLSPERLNTKKATHANNVHDFSAAVVANILADAAAHSGQVITLRTHRGPSPQIESVIRQGRAAHHVCIRDPRDVALSFLDAARRLNLLGNMQVRSDSLQSILPMVRRGIEVVSAWCEIPGTLVLRYEETGFTPRVTIGAICRQLKLDLPEAAYEAVFAKAAAMKNNKFNVAESMRHRREMSESDQILCLKTFQEFYERFFPDAIVAVETPITGPERVARSVATEERLAKVAARRRLKAERHKHPEGKARPK